MEITTILYEMNLFLFNENKLLLYLGKRESIKHVKNNRELQAETGNKMKKINLYRKSYF